jgi:type II secretory pathway pseudopilin PulG
MIIDSVVAMRQPARRAFSMIEATIATLIVGGMLVAAITAVGGSARARQTMTDRELGALLAQQLMSEILPLAYEEPDEVIAFGREPSESAGSRAAYDDVDDYDGWSASPPQDKAGNDLPNLDGWKRSVTVELTSPDDMTQKAASDLGLKRITVTVSRNDVDAATLVAVRSLARDNAVAE